MPLKFQSTGGGTVTLDVPSTSSTVTLTIPANTGNLVIADASGNVTINGPLLVAQNSTTQLDVVGEIAEFAHTANSYVQVHVRNASSGRSASSDIVATSDNGTDTSNFIDLGINNSTYVDANWTINGPSDGYLYTSNGNLSIGTATSKPLSFFTGGTLAANERMKIESNGAISGTLTGTAGNLMLISGTANSSISGATFVDFTGIPSWVKRVTVMFNGVSTNGVSPYIIQIGSGSVTSTGYISAGINYGTTSLALANFTTGMAVINVVAAAYTYSGIATISNISGNTWAYSAQLGSGSTAFGSGAGSSSALSGALDRVRITTVNGTDTFDAGSINILYE
ncbi:hypothetical protein UFOVP908_143 [uncultured Caudovirales phage]|uniref:Uncharacterized protein n=1 Tax=uncultured Caudovirales phage TaxID=2100421 RepID=A0A6J5PLC5_9CAUD|nr:hypothetical protein UFOVP908_143 [uncultured Caudovirales phage]CAB4177175.1 hypothetical protein UFOVP990_226 [uncultured Caudovirales phage]CAB4181350.1 hypothetical protein UFOVP1065_24 [uncultured Caudovirales phage]CAB4190886.1 hypothetical protein UFOVP1198_226 [uncultured Caudovirales phage]CAB4211237.1 hypothetical protein UFOVP1418_218 [uncultured Caudovirales phage]